MLAVFRLLAVREVTSHATRSVLTGAGVAIGCAVVVAVLALNHSVLDGFQGMVNTLAGGADLQVRGGQAGVPADLVDKVAQDPAVAAAGAYLEAWILDPATGERVLLVGVDFLAEEPAPGLLDKNTVGEAALEQVVEEPIQFLNSTDLVLFNADYARRLPIKRGEGRNYVTPTGPRALKAAGVLQDNAATRALGGAVAIMSVDAAQLLLNKPNRVDVINVRLKVDSNVRQVQKRLAAQLGSALTVEEPERRGKRLGRMMLVLTTVMRLISVVAILVGIFIVQNTLSTAVMQRRREIAIQRALGVLRGAAAFMVVAEAAVLATLGAAMGVPAGLGMARAAMGVVRESVATLYAEIPTSTPDVSPMAAGLVALGAVVLSALAALRPAQHATRVPPALVLGAKGGAPPPTPLRWPYGLAGLAVVAGGLAFVAAHLPQVGTEPWWGYVACLLVLSAGAAAAPITLLVVQRGMQPLADRAGVALRLGAQGLTREGSRAVRTVIALMLGLALYIGISSVVHSYKVTLLTWVDQAVPADLSVLEGSSLPSARAVPMPPAMGDGLAADPGVERVVFQRFRLLDLGEQVTRVQALDAEGYLARAKLPVVEQVGPVDAAALMGGEVFLSHNLARTLNLHAGDVINLPAAAGPKALKIRAVVEDYSSEVGSLFMDWKVYAALFQDPQVDAFMLYLRPNADPEAVRTRIMARYGEGRNLNVVTHAAFKKFVEEIVDDAFAATRALQLVAVLIALMGIINTLLAAVLDRQREIGVLRAVGATRGQVITILTTEAVLLGLCSALLAVGVGLAFGAVFTTAVADSATGWQLPFKIPFQAVGESFLVALAVAAVAAAAPAGRAANVDVLHAMREE